MIIPEKFETGAAMTHENLVGDAAKGNADPDTWQMLCATLAVAYQLRTANWIAAADAGLIQLRADEILDLNHRLGRL
jgi:hypothetical protein